MDDNVTKSFAEYFEMVPAASDDLRNEVYKLRYQVYCTETGFLNFEHYPNGLECDEYDGDSIHYLIRHRQSGVYAATTRLVMPDCANLDRPFPIEQHSRIENADLMKTIPRDKLAEVSRFCVSKAFKRRKHEAGTLAGIRLETVNEVSENERRTYPHITLALIASLIKISDDRDIRYWYAVMEPALLRFLSTLGIHFTDVGPMTDYHGMRLPCVIKVSDLLNGVARKDSAISEMLTGKGRYKPEQEYHDS